MGNLSVGWELLPKSFEGKWKWNVEHRNYYWKTERNGAHKIPCLYDSLNIHILHPPVILLISIKIIDKVVFTKTSRVLVTKGGADLGKSLAEQGESLSRANHALNIWLDYGPTVKHCDSSDIYNLHFS